jgi:hypothetical protein
MMNQHQPPNEDKKKPFSPEDFTAYIIIYTLIIQHMATVSKQPRQRKHDAPFVEMTLRCFVPLSVEGA